MRSKSSWQPHRKSLEQAGLAWFFATRLENGLSQNERLQVRLKHFPRKVMPATKRRRMSACRCY